MKILVTGGAGYLGSVLIPKLLVRGHSVRVIDVGYFGMGHLRGYRPQIETVRDDIRRVIDEPAFAEQLLDGVDSIIQNRADAYWGNGMRVALGEHLGLAKLHLDLRRGDGPPGARYYNFAALTARESLTKEHPEVAAGAIRAIVTAQKALKENPSISTEIGQRLFPADEAELIAGLIERDAPFYDAEISHDAVDGLMKFAKSSGLINAAVPYEDLVATEFGHLWKE